MHTPFRLIPGRGRNHPRTVIRDANDNLVGVVESGNDSDALKAAIRAVNSHAQLVAALDNLTQAVIDDDKGLIELSCSQARAALAAAKGV
jgi:hypothetical protein